MADLDGLRHRLYTERGFAGNTANYYEPDNSFLHRVLARRTGIPISLAVVMIEVGRRAEVHLEGVGMPGHFLVRDPASGVVLDPFDGGRTLDDAALEARFRASTGAGDDVPFGAHLLPGVTAHGILHRMLANLTGIYRARGAGRDLEWVLRMCLALPTADASTVVELGEVLASRGRYREGAEEVETRAAGDDRLLAAARALRARLN